MCLTCACGDPYDKHGNDAENLPAIQLYLGP